MAALLTGLLAALIWAVHDLLARKLSPGAALLPIVLAVLGAGLVVLIPPAVIWGDWSRLNPPSVLVAMGAGLAFALAIAALYRAFSMAPARIVSPVIGAYPVLALGIAVAQGRAVTGWDWLSVAAVVLGIGIVSMTAGGGDTPRRTLPAMGWSFLSGCGFAATFALGQEAARQGSELPTILITRTAALATIAALFLVNRSRLAGLSGNWPVICVMGAADALALTLVTAAGGLPNAEYATVASSLFGVGTILLAWYFLKETLRPLQWIGVVVVFSGIGLLSAQG